MKKEKKIYIGWQRGGKQKLIINYDIGVVKCTKNKNKNIIVQDENIEN